MTTKSKEGNLHAKHRARMRSKYRSFGCDVFNEHEILEMVLYGFLPRADTNATAHRLINRFGSLRDVLYADEKELVTVQGIGMQTAEKITKILPLVETILERSSVNTSVDDDGEIPYIARQIIYHTICSGEGRTVFTPSVGIKSFGEFYTLDNTEIPDIRKIAKAAMLLEMPNAVICEESTDGESRLYKKISESLAASGISVAEYYLVCGNTCFSLVGGGIFDINEIRHSVKPCNIEKETIE